MALTEKLSAIGDAIRAKTGGTALLTLDQMPTEIAAIETGGGGSGGDLPEEAFVITGDCQNRFAYNGWNWFIDQYGDKVTTSEISNLEKMFSQSDGLTEIPFEINTWEGYETRATAVFDGCQNLTKLPKINCTPSTTESIFRHCSRLKEIPDDVVNGFDWSYMDNSTNAYMAQQNRFNYCCSLREIPMELMAHGQPSIYEGYAVYVYAFEGCFALDELVDLPNPHYSATWTSNVFRETFSKCSRLKKLTFKTPDGAPYIVNWNSQTIDLTKYVGYADYKEEILSYNSGITEDKQVTDATSYAALKDNPDWFTCDVAYSRYNHDSAVVTINSLPDTSAYLAANGGTNTIKFKGDSGSATDGGAINTLTEEEIAVAAAKGWTVTLV